jgi:penicillin-binding protein 1A
MYSKAIKLAIILALCPSLLGVGMAYSLVNYLEIPDIKNLESYRPKSATRLYADDGTLFAELYVEKRVPIPITQMPQHLKSAFIAIEDVRFYDHFGVDLRGIARAAYRNIARKGMTEGASTITQQLARNLYLTHKKSFKRKIEEAVLAIQIERTYSKDEILNLYLNLIYLGEGAYGVEAASYTYFHKKASELALQESAMLAALTKSPSKLSPYKNPKGALERRNTVLRRMHDVGFITQKEYAAAVKTPIDVVPFRAYEKKTGFFTEYVKQVVEEYVKDPQEVYTTGLNIQTTMNLKMTQDAYEAIRKGLDLYRKRHPDAQEPPEVAMVVMDVKTSEIKVLIGGTDFGRSPFNRATQAKRQPGSAFKPIIYLAALEQGLTPSTMLRDGPLSFTNPYSKQVWSPKNYKNEYHGNVSMSRALALSLNTATVRLLERVGVENVIELVKRLHVNGKFEPNLSLALGTTEISPLDLASAYAVFARGGTYLPPTAVKAVATMDGETVYNEDVQEEKVVAPEHTTMLVEMMRGVIQSGTARSASQLPFQLAGKTGTTDDFKDAWFVGFSPDLLCLVWTGYDKHSLLGKGESGATASLPIWIEFMSRTLPSYAAGSVPSPDPVPAKPR